MISKTGLHAIRALVQLADLAEGQHLGAAQIAREIGAPPNYQGKLLRDLTRRGLVESQKGPRGGFRLAREAGRIRLLDVVDPIEHVGRWNDCLLGSEQCLDSAPCAVHARWKPLREQYLQLLKETTIATLRTKSASVEHGGER